MAIDGPDQHTTNSGQASDAHRVAELYASLPAIAAILDERGIILALSEQAAAKFGANAPRLVGRSVLSLAHHDDRASVARAIGHALDHRSQIAHCEFRIWRGNRPALRLRTSIRAATSTSGPTTLLAVASDITDQVLLEQQLNQRSSELSEMTNRLVIAQYEERRKLAADMHDGIGHSLALAKFQVDGLRAMALAEPARKTVENVAQRLKEAIDSVRSLTFELNSTPLDDRGLDAAVDELGHSLSLANNLHFSLSSRPRPERLTGASRILLYRTIRELLVNVVKHANAKHVRVSIGLADARLAIAVVDDGVGIANPETQVTAGSGLRSIRQRIEALGGRLSIESRPRAGTRVSITLPYSEIS